MAMSEPQRVQKPTHFSLPSASSWQKSSGQAQRAFESMNRRGSGAATGGVFVTAGAVVSTAGEGFTEVVMVESNSNGLRQASGLAGLEQLRQVDEARPEARALRVAGGCPAGERAVEEVWGCHFSDSFNSWRTRDYARAS